MWRPSRPSTTIARKNPPSEEALRELEELVPEFRPPRRYLKLAVRILIAALLAVAAMMLIFYILDKHVRDAQTSAAAKRPIYIHVLPQK